MGKNHTAEFKQEAVRVALTTSVTAERIRDKIAASKRKGLWMGGKPIRSQNYWQ